MGRTRGTYWGGRRCIIQGFVEGIWQKREHLEDLGVDRMIILKYIFENWDGA
jgi:hypothetical protein